MFKYIFKLIIIGNNNVGKSSIIKSFNNDYFDQKYHSTIGIDFASKIIKLEDNTVVKLQIWDTAGTERFKSIVRNYYRGCIGGIIVFDVTNRQSFDNVIMWYNDLLMHTNKKAGELTILLVGNKNDLEKRVISQSEASNLAYDLKIPYLETSAKLNENIDEIFYTVSDNIYEKIKNNEVFVEEHKIFNKFQIKESNSSSRLKNITKCCVIS
tara:strand:- start:1335 stop:1967 length:633 start_codon:yes stop_codon:yes gene_type:complete